MGRPIRGSLQTTLVFHVANEGYIGFADQACSLYVARIEEDADSSLKKKKTPPWRKRCRRFRSHAGKTSEEMTSRRACGKEMHEETYICVCFPGEESDQQAPRRQSLCPTSALWRGRQLPKLLKHLKQIRHMASEQAWKKLCRCIAGAVETPAHGVAGGTSDGSTKSNVVCSPVRGIIREEELI